MAVAPEVAVRAAEAEAGAPAPPSSSGLLDLLADGAHPRARLQLPATGVTTDLGAVWRRGEQAGAWLRRRYGPGATVAMVLTPTVAGLAALVGAWQAGLTVASIPSPARLPLPEEVRRRLARMCELVGASGLLADGAVVGQLQGLCPSVLAYEAVGAARPLGGGAGGGGFVQFTSGSTTAPKGVVLSLTAIGANVAATRCRLDHERPVLCSWLPLSHDLGLGSLLTAWSNFAPRFAGEGEAVLYPVQTFLRRPSTWMDLCSRHRATGTAGPTFAYHTAARRLRRGHRPLDLRHLRMAVVGGEAVTPGALREFVRAAEPHGFSPRALCPAYGLAEATVGVTLVHPDEPWRAVTPPALGHELVSCGRPLDGVEVRIADAPGPGAPGAIEIRSPGLLSGYVGGAAALTGGWLRTDDLGLIDRGELLFVDRADDTVVTGGRNVHLSDVTAAAGEVVHLLSGTALVGGGPGGWAVVAEQRRGRSPEEGWPDLLRGWRARLVDSVGVGPASMVVAAPGSLPRTTSGKVRRDRLRQQFERGELSIVGEWQVRHPRPALEEESRRG